MFDPLPSLTASSPLAPSAGILVLAGVWLLASPIVATTLYLGSLEGTLLACLLGAPATEIYSGLWGFNPSLAFATVAGLFFKLSRRSLFLAVCAAACAVVTHGAVGSFLRPQGLPPLTFPAAITGILFCMFGAAQPHFGLVPELSDVAVPEDYLRRPRYLRLPYLGRWGFKQPAACAGEDTRPTMAIPPPLELTVDRRRAATAVV